MLSMLRFSYGERLNDMHSGRILLLSPLPPPVGGIASWTEQVMNWASKNDVKIDIINTAVIGLRRMRSYSWSLLEEGIRTTRIIVGLVRLMILYKYSAVHLNTSCSSMGLMRDYLCAIIVKFRRVKLVVHYRCNIDDQLKDRMIPSLFFRRLVKCASVNLVLNSKSQSVVEDVAGCSAQIIPNMIEDDFLIEKKKEISNNILKISFVGHVRKEKGVFEIIETSRHFPQIQFSLAGPIAEDVRLVTLPNNVNLLGALERTEVMRLLDSTDVFLFPTYTEGFANALLEAMARGLPVITTPVGANKDMIENMGGIMVDTRSVVSIVNAIHAMQDVNSRISMSNWNIGKVRSQYMADIIIPQLLKLYNT